MAQRRDPLLAFIGGAIMGIGALVASLCGACTLLFGSGVLFDAMAGRGGGDGFQIDLPTVAIIGGVPTAIGLGLFFGGRSLYRSGAKPGNGASNG